MSSDEQVCKSWYENSYGRLGFAAQRRYPNEELLRFFGRYYFPVPFEQRKNIRILEVGCGSGANLWMIAREGFDAYGVDLSAEGIKLCKSMLRAWGATATLNVASMTSCPFPANFFDAVIDVFSANCLDEAGFSEFMNEATRLLRRGGRFFSYAPSKKSDAFLNPGPSRRLDASTLDGIHRKDAPFYGNNYSFRFINNEEYRSELEKRGLKVTYNEKVGRTYHDGREYFEVVVIAAERDAEASLAVTTFSPA